MNIIEIGSSRINSAMLVLLHPVISVVMWTANSALHIPYVINIGRATKKNLGWKKKIWHPWMMYNTIYIYIYRPFVSWSAEQTALCPPLWAPLTRAV